MLMRTVLGDGSAQGSTQTQGGTEGIREGRRIRQVRMGQREGTWMRSDSRACRDRLPFGGRKRRAG